MRNGTGSGSNGDKEDGKGGGTSSKLVGECPGVRPLSMRNDFDRGTDRILLFRFRFCFVISFSSLVTNAIPALASARPLVCTGVRVWEYSPLRRVGSSAMDGVGEVI